MIVITGYALIYIGGFAYLYIHLFYHGFCNPSSTIINDEIDGEVNVNYHQLVESEADEAKNDSIDDFDEYEYDDDDDVSDSSLEEYYYHPEKGKYLKEEEEDEGNHRFSWDIKTHPVPTFKKPLNKDESSSPPRPKCVKFSSTSLEHSTFSREEYKRRNEVWIKRLKALQEKPDKLNRIYLQMELFKYFEMEIHQEPTENEEEEEEKKEELEGSVEYFENAENDHLF